MNDLELQALWQGQSRELPSAYSPADLERRSAPTAELALPSSAFEEARLVRQVAVATRLAGLAVGVCSVALLVAMAATSAWLAVALAGFAVVGWRVHRLLVASRALRTVRGLRERPVDMTPPLVPLVAFTAVVLLSLATYFIVGRSIARQQHLRANAVAEPSAEAVDAWATACASASSRLSDAELEAAARACEKATQYAALEGEAVSWARHVVALGACPRAMSEVTASLSKGQVVRALDVWARVPPACAERVGEGWPLRPEQLERLLSGERQRCLEAEEDMPELDACRLVAVLSCRAPDADVEPPAGRVFQPEGPLGDTGWRPADPAVLRSLRVHAQPWTCPGWVGLHSRPPRPEADQPFTSSAWPASLQPALQAWMNGDERRAEAALAAATVAQPTRDAFTRDFAAVRKAFAEAHARLAAGADAPADTEATVRAALDADARFLFRGEPSRERLRSLAKYDRSPRAQLVSAMGVAAYARGRRLADAKDFRGACLAWKQGAAFTLGNLDLLKALTNVCTPSARRKLDDAESCADLREVLDFAVDGDGLAEEARDQLEADRCP